LQQATNINAPHDNTPNRNTTFFIVALALAM
jgi:hypothetical protein